MTEAAPPPAVPAPPVAPTPSVGTTGLVYADTLYRILAYVIDVIILGIIGLVIGAILSAIGLASVSGNIETGFTYNYVASVIGTLIGLVISAVYFVYTWASMRGTLGMKVLGMQIGNAGDGKTLTTEQAVRRWIALGAPFTVAQLLNPIPLLGLIIGIAALAWVIFLLYTTANSPTKQGWHDKFANTQVVKVARVIA